METIRPVYKKLLILGIVIYVIGIAMTMTNIYYKICSIEHTLTHIEGSDGHKH